MGEEGEGVAVVRPLTPRQLQLVGERGLRAACYLLTSKYSRLSTARQEGRRPRAE